MVWLVRIMAAAALVWLAAPPAPAWAYVGPGAGISLLGAVIGLLVAIATALGIVIAWPARAAWRRWKANRLADQAPAGAADPARADRGGGAADP